LTPLGTIQSTVELEGKSRGGGLLFLVA